MKTAGIDKSGKTINAYFQIDAAETRKNFTQDSHKVEWNMDGNTLYVIVNGFDLGATEAQNFNVNGASCADFGAGDFQDALNALFQ